MEPDPWAGRRRRGSAPAVLIGLAVNRLQLDMAVYLLGGRNLVNGRLYLVGLPHPPHLPFTYPPFAALVFRGSVRSRWARRD